MHTTVSAYMFPSSMMIQTRILSVVLLVLSLNQTSSSDNDSPIISTSRGLIVGTRLQFNSTDPKLSRSLDVYFGIPYAEPPVGPLRFRPPVKKSPWTGQLQATKIGNRCPQPTLSEMFYIPGNKAEDCLVLDVYVPRPVRPEVVVMVFIHGGGFTIGAASMEEMLPTGLAAVGDVIVVAIEYRLGALGFLSTGDDVIPGNMGLLDQRLALEWVKENIGAFGGDPQRVVIFGESAGGASVSYHMISPRSAGLFYGAIMESGDAVAPWAFTGIKEARKRAFAFGKLLGCEVETSQELLVCLQRQRDVNRILESQQKVQRKIGAGGVFGVSFTPVVDGNFVPLEPNDIYEMGAINDAVSIIGANADEGTMLLLLTIPNTTYEAPFVDSSTYDSLVRDYLSPISLDPIAIDLVDLMYRNASALCEKAPNRSYFQSLSQILGDMFFVCPADKAARAFAKAGRKVYLYHMTHVPNPSFYGNNWMGATHGNDLVFAFGVPLIPSEMFPFTAEDAEVSIQMINYWSNLAKTGNPNLASIDANLTFVADGDWPEFTISSLFYKDISPSMRNGCGAKAKECLLWNEFLPKLVRIANDAQRCHGAHETPNDWTRITALLATLEHLSRE